MAESDWLAERFEEHRSHLRAIAYRMLGSISEADDAVQDAWLRFSQADTSRVENLGGWLTTIVARVCLNLLRTRRQRGEQSLEGRLPEPIISPADSPDPQQEALLGDAVGLAMLVVLDRLAPAERVAFVLHDVFGVPFDEIGPIVGRTAPAARQLASRARRRVRGTAPMPDAGLRQQRRVVEAFRAASRDGNFDALLALLDPRVVARADIGVLAPRAPRTVRGAEAVAAQAIGFRKLAQDARPAMVNGTAGLVVIRDGQPFAVLGFSIAGGRIVELDIFSDPARLGDLDLAALAP
jgi:RNA polymerase sigma factor (sigma-70 family)